MYIGLWEIFRERLIAAYAPDDASPIGRLIAEADAIEAEKETFQKTYTAASVRVRQLEAAVFKPRTAYVRLGSPESAELERQAAELVEVRKKVDAIGHELTIRTTKVRDIQNEIGRLLLDTTIEEAAKKRERERLLRA